MVELSQKNDLVHNINSSIAALQGALELINDHWRNDPDLIQRIIPISIEKLEDISEQLAQYHNNSQK